MKNVFLSVNNDTETRLMHSFKTMNPKCFCLFVFHFSVASLMIYTMQRHLWMDFEGSSFEHCIDCT